MIRFSNKGEIDLRLVTTMGVNVKEADSPIGYFGTGLKYAIAVLLREDISLRILSGTNIVTFIKVPDTIRGKSFDFIRMITTPWQGEAQSAQLGFTTDLGKNWSLQHAYRELYSNCMDEGGEVLSEDHGPFAAADMTHILVEGPEFDKVHRERFAFLLDPARPKLTSDGSVEIYSGRSDYIFYKGIAALKLPQASTCLYNIIAPMTLTEDRTLNSEWSCHQLIENVLLANAPRHVMEAAFTSRQSYEALNLQFTFSHPSDHALDILEDILKTAGADATDSVVKILARHRKREIPREEIELNPVQMRQLASAIDFWTAVGYPLNEYDIKLATSLGRRVVGLAEGTTIWLTDRAFCDEHMLRTTLIEEFCHIRFRVADASREMQNVLFTEMARLAEALLEAREGQSHPKVAGGGLL